ncbi:predicted protein [Botrytis cinerea T4]|uniref:Uncharacterized protein n=1 Tax=Botryotinia fuckeliana (strain T4) TaxID=999810 RepID=G2YCK7_BOTF4|nr:predicted protein [Botrytis cinerea T4]
MDLVTKRNRRENILQVEEHWMMEIALLADEQSTCKNNETTFFQKASRVVAGEILYEQ